MPTILGVIFFLIGSYYFLFQEDGLFGLLIVASIFQASSFIKFGDRGIPIFYLIEVTILARAVVNQAFRVRPIRSVPQWRWLLTFGMVAVASIVIGPLLFARTPVYDPLLGIDEGLLVRPALQFRMTNVVQAGYLLFHIMTIYAVLSLPFSWEKTRKAYLLAFYLVVFCVLAQAFSMLTGVPYPDAIVRNNPNIWDLALYPGPFRKPGTFLEPSFAGAFLVVYSVGFIAEYLQGRGSAWKVVLSLMASAAVTSSGSLLTLFLCVIGLLIHYSPFRSPWFINLRQVRRIGWALVLLLGPIAVVLLAAANYRALLLEATLAKSDTGSFFNRTTSDLYGLELLVRTYGIGVGLGSNRASSLFTSLASNVGLVGLLCFGVFCIKLFTGITQEMEWLKWACFGLLLNMCVDVPDVTFPVLWIAILLAMQCSKQQDRPDLVAQPAAFARAGT